eukprot:m.16190 g.16190  ORF g.16190 m.16190 type:complete len:835 (+) comp6835_c0_seq1:151-2655(+)
MLDMKRFSLEVPRSPVPEALQEPNSLDSSQSSFCSDAPRRSLITRLLSVQAHGPASSLLTALPVSAREALLAGSEDVLLPPGAVVLEEGTPSTCMYFVIEGTLCITKSGVEIARLETGHMIGELGAITGETRTAGAVALTHVRLLCVAAPRFLSVIDRFPEIYRSIMRDLSSKIRGAQQVQVKQTQTIHNILDILAKTVSDEVLSILVDDQPDDLLRGRTANAVILFFDIRGFSSAAESMRPQDLLQALNDHLLLVTEEVQASGGTIVNFIGDAVLAVFGVPQPLAHPADAALDCYARCCARLATETRVRTQAGKVCFRMAAGMNFGLVVAGALGSRSRFTYSVLGDEVNLAARLEGLTRHYPVDVIFSQAVYDCFSPENQKQCLLLDCVQVKGRVSPVRIYTLIPHHVLPSLPRPLPGLSAREQKLAQLSRRFSCDALCLAPAADPVESTAAEATARALASLPCSPSSLSPAAPSHPVPTFLLSPPTETTPEATATTTPVLTAAETTSPTLTVLSSKLAPAPLLAPRLTSHSLSALCARSSLSSIPDLYSALDDECTEIAASALCSPHGTIAASQATSPAATEPSVHGCKKRSLIAVFGQEVALDESFVFEPTKCVDEEKSEHDGGGHSDGEADPATCDAGATPPRRIFSAVPSARPSMIVPLAAVADMRWRGGRRARHSLPCSEGAASQPLSLDSDSSPSSRARLSSAFDARDLMPGAPRERVSITPSASTPEQRRQTRQSTELSAFLQDSPAARRDSFAAFVNAIDEREENQFDTEQFRRATALYLDGQFTAAQPLFRATQSALGDFFVERCRRCALKPGPWPGYYTWSTK